MKFLDYEKIIRDNYPILIESYIKQYGEEYREHIVDALERVKYCFYATPVTIGEYINRKRNEDFFKAVIDFYDEDDICTSDIFIDEDELVINDEKVKFITETLFPWVFYGKNDDKIEGLFLFDEKFNDLDFDNYITKDRIILLKKFFKKDLDESDYDYYKNGNYEKDCLFMNKILNIFLKYYDMYCSDDYFELWEYGRNLKKDMYNVGLKYEKEFMIAIKEYLCDCDGAVIDSGIDFDVRALKDYYVFFDKDFVESSVAFSEGPIDFFSDNYTDILLSSSSSVEEKEEIVKMRLDFLRLQGIDVSFLEDIDLYCDWYQIDCLKEYLMDKEMLEDVLCYKSMFVDKYNYEIAKLSVINDYDLLETDPEIETIIDSNGHSCSLYVRDDFLADKPISMVCLCPFNDTYNLFDVAIDHELRHAIETRIKEKENGYIVKIGTNIVELSSEFSDSKSFWTLYNEIITEKLSVEACFDRWRNGQFIFSDKFALKTIYPLSVYEYCFQNFDILYDEFRKDIIDTQISSDFDNVYNVFSKEELEVIDSSMDILTDDTKDKFSLIRDKVCERRKVKIKKL